MNILVIDDHELFRGGIKLLLEKLDEIQKVHTAESGTEALALVESSIDLDIILLDYNLPDISGMQTLKKLKESVPEIPVVILSSEESPSRIQEAMQIGANGFITKSSSAEVTISAVKLVLSGGMYLPPQLLFSAEQSQAPEATEEVKATPPKAEFIVKPQTPVDASKLRISGGAHNKPYNLTLRQNEVLVQISEGHSNKAIAKNLNMSLSTVKVHVTAIFRELGVSNRVQAVKRAKEHRLITDQ